MTKYLTVAETAKLIRTALKNEFPGVRFSVRSKSYAGGASIRIVYFDGPAYEKVKAVADRFEGAGFDGSVDYKFSKYHWLLPDGTIAYAGTAGSACTGGYHNKEEIAPPCEGAIAVHLGADYVVVDRDHTKENLLAAVASVASEWGVLDSVPADVVRVWDHDGSAHIAKDFRVPNAGLNFSTLVHRKIGAIDFGVDKIKAAA